MSETLNLIWCQWDGTKHTDAFYDMVLASYTSFKKNSGVRIKPILITPNVERLKERLESSMPDLQYTDPREAFSGLPAEHEYHNWREKIKHLVSAPDGLCLYVDADTYCVGSLESLFGLSKRFDLMIAPERGHFDRFSNVHGSGKIDPEISYDFPCLQGGVIAFNQSNSMKQFFMFVLEEYNRIQKAFPSLVEDQIVFRSAIWNSDGIRFFHLPKRFNFEHPMDAPGLRDRHHDIPMPQASQEPAIYHYTYYKNEPKTLSEKAKQMHEKLVRRALGT